MKPTLLVTGTTSGVGLSLCRHLKDRFRIIALGRDRTRLETLYGDERDIDAYSIDLRDRAGLQKLAQRIEEDVGGIPYLINNAGVNIAGKLQSLSLEVLDESFAVNVSAPYILMRTVLPGMSEKGFGRIINVTSGAPLNCFPGFGAYSASKGALNALTLTAAREHAHANIKINLMSPGPVRSNMAPDAPMEPAVCHPTVDYLLRPNTDGPTGRFFWLGHEIPILPNLEGMEWLEGRAPARFRRVL